MIAEVAIAKAIDVYIVGLGLAGLIFVEALCLSRWLTDAKHEILKAIKEKEK